MREIAALLLMIAVAAVLIVAIKERGPQPKLPLVNTKAKVWTDVWAAPPQFCPTPLPICRGDKCPKQRSVA